MLWLFASFLPQIVKLKLVHSLIVPLILSGSNVYGVLDAESKSKLQLPAPAPFVYDKRKIVHISQLAQDILGNTLTTFLKIRNLLFLHKLIYASVSDFFFFFFPNKY